MKKNKIILTLLCVSIMMPTANTFASFIAEESAFDSVNNDSELGYIFKLNHKPIPLLSDDSNVTVISEDLLIYRADTIEDIEAFTSESNIALIEEDKVITIEESEDIDFTDLLDSTASDVELMSVAEDDSASIPEYPYGANDTYYSEQWQMEYCHIPAFWQNGITGRGVRVGVIDSGIFREHDDFEGIDIEQGINVVDYLDGKEDCYDTSDGNGHGTAVTSMIAAATNNNNGIAGIVNECTIVPFKVLDSEKTYLHSATMKAIELSWSEYDIDVLNISLASSVFSEIDEEIIDEATKHGVIIVAGVGNDGDATLNYPASYDNVIGAGAFHTYNGEAYHSFFSNTNESVFISAPGALLITISWSTVGTNYYYTDAVLNGNTMGTSFASPVVAAAAAGAKQLFPDMTTDQFKELLKETAIDMNEEGYDVTTGYGRIDFANITEKLLEWQNDPELMPTEHPTAEPIPDGAVSFSDLLTSTAPENRESQKIIVDEYKNKREVVYVPYGRLWYVGKYDINMIDKITVRMACTGHYTDGVMTNMPSLSFFYYPLDDSVEINDDMFSVLPKTFLWSSKYLVGQIEASTEPDNDIENGYKYLGALFEIDSEEVRVSPEDTYDVFPGGTVTLGSHCSALKAPVSGEVALFAYAYSDLSTQHITTDYIIIDEKEVTPEPTLEPTAEPTIEPSATPTATPTAVPTATPTIEPTFTPTVEPTTNPTTTDNPLDDYERTPIPTENIDAPESTENPDAVSTDVPEPTTSPTDIPSVTDGPTEPIPTITEEPVPKDIDLSIWLDEDKHIAYGIIFNNTDKYIDSVNMIALYDENGKLKSLSIYEGLEANYDTQITIFYDTDTDYKVVCYVWDNLNHMKPLVDASSALLK